MRDKEKIQKPLGDWKSHTMKVKEQNGIGVLNTNPEDHTPMECCLQNAEGDGFQTRLIHPAKLSIKDPKTEPPICSFQGSYWHIYYNQMRRANRERGWLKIQEMRKQHRRKVKGIPRVMVKRDFRMPIVQTARRVAGPFKVGGGQRAPRKQWNW